MRAVPQSPDGSGSAFVIQVGMERPAEMVPRPLGEVLMENKVARTYLRRADFEQWEVSVLENWSGATASSQRSMLEGNCRPVDRRLVWIRTTGCG